MTIERKAGLAGFSSDVPQAGENQRTADTCPVSEAVLLRTYSSGSAESRTPPQAQPPPLWGRSLDSRALQASSGGTSNNPFRALSGAAVRGRRSSCADGSECAAAVQ